MTTDQQPDTGPAGAVHASGPHTGQPVDRVEPGDVGQPVEVPAAPGQPSAGGPAATGPHPPADDQLCADPDCGCCYPGGLEEAQPTGEEVIRYAALVADVIPVGHRAATQALIHGLLQDGWERPAAAGPHPDTLERCGARWVDDPAGQTICALPAEPPESVTEPTATIAEFWDALGEQKPYFQMPDVPFPDPIYRIRTRPGFIFDDNFWDVFHRFGFHVCHVAYYGPGRTEENVATCDGVFELRWVDARQRPLSTVPPEPYTAAELAAGVAAVHELEGDTAERYLTVQQEVAAALRAVLPLHAARIRREVAEWAEHKWRVSTTRELGRDAEAELRIKAATAIIQSGYEDQDEDDPDAWDLVETIACTDCPSVTRRCGCSGVPWIADRAWSTLGAVFAEHARRIRRATAEGIAASLEHFQPEAANLDICYGTAMEHAATVARLHATAPTEKEDQDG